DALPIAVILDAAANRPAADLRPPPDGPRPDAEPPLPTAFFRTVTFTKTSGRKQVVPHLLGVPPRALLLWTTGQRAAEPSAPAVFFSVGVSAGPRASQAVSLASAGGGAASHATRRIADRVVSVGKRDGALETEA